ncbi:TIGR03016 family PEP-CTERM system-associated outer membrane protein [Neptunomonas antarctica]|uniref:Uncharacterized protein, PEP-CTERM system associated n=1 Tax=Neptunomonas antarctica TaxID=619304 RepID=A0A1N7JDZ3_9GAMM|nr:TIGR03016 family PEP-CTERM system-associated outer membrane protein [Neptunomonas antarctica]SIS47583.1 uncharacterized protein, PEP-CTERM system associated [Neptunomonas antarctica]
MYPRSKSVTACLFLGLFGAENVLSADWQISKSITLAEVFTDNVDLEHDNKNSEWITTVTPNISVQANGARANLSLTGSLEANTGGGGSNSINPRLGASADAEVIEDFVFIDTSANITQNTVDAFSPSGVDSLNSTENTTNTYNYNISPYFTQRFKGAAEVTGRYTYNYQLNSSADVDDSSSQAVMLGVNSGSDFTQFTWGSTVNYKDSNSDTTGSELLSAGANFGYKLNRSWQLQSSLGYEWNEIDTNIRDSSNGTQWSLAAVWTPTTRTSLSIGYGDRFFGSTPTLDFSHRSRKSVFTASYSRELTDSATLLSQQDAFSTTDAFGEPIDPITGDPLPVSNSTINVTDGVFVDERFDLAYTLTGKRSTFRVGGSHSTQRFEDGRSDEILQEYNVGLTRQLSRTLDANLGVTVSQQSRESSEDTTTINYDLGVTRKVGVDGKFNLSYRLIDSSSDDITNDYQENRLQFSYTMSL